VIACGGDGTLLQAAHRFRGSGIPLLGINDILSEKLQWRGDGLSKLKYGHA